ncbi:MAG TPA: hypothetical protein ENG77_05025, partial [Chromatiales bacterium]|nr:hypothetical protein [Chromatiales bacterium]
MKQWIGLALVVLAAGSSVVSWPTAHADEEGEGPPIAAPQRVFVRHGVTYLRLSKHIQKAIGLQIEALKFTHYRARLQAYGQVIDLNALLDSYQQLVSARAKAAQSNVQLDAARAEYRRLEGLYRHHRNASEKQVQTAGANWLSDQAAATAAETRLSSVTDRLGARWGATIARWMRKDSPSFRSLTDGRSRLLELTLPLGKAPAAAHRTALVLLANGTTVAASLISPSPVAEPDLQGQAYFFLATSAIGQLNYRLRITGLIPYGSRHSGVVVPDSAVVWSQGSAWIYVETRNGRFERKPIRTDTPVPEGWFQTDGLSPGSQVVTQGAEVLLSVQTLAGAPKGRAG